MHLLISSYSFFINWIFYFNIIVFTETLLIYEMKFKFKQAQLTPQHSLHLYTAYTSTQLTLLHTVIWFTNVWTFTLCENHSVYYLNLIYLLFFKTYSLKMSRKFCVGGNWKMNGTKSSIDEIVLFLTEGPLDDQVGG